MLSTLINNETRTQQTSISEEAIQKQLRLLEKYHGMRDGITGKLLKDRLDFTEIKQEYFTTFHPDTISRFMSAYVGPKEDPNYKKLFQFAEKWKNQYESDPRQTTVYDLFGTTRKDEIRMLFPRESIIKVSERLGYKVDLEDRPVQLPSLANSHEVKDLVVRINRGLTDKGVTDSSKHKIDEFITHSELERYDDNHILAAAYISNLYIERIANNLFKTDGKIEQASVPELTKVLELYCK